MFISNNALNDKHNFLLPMKKKKKKEKRVTDTSQLPQSNRKRCKGQGFLFSFLSVLL